MTAGHPLCFSVSSKCLKKKTLLTFTILKNTVSWKVAALDIWQQQYTGFEQHEGINIMTVFVFRWTIPSIN